MSLLKNLKNNKAIFTIKQSVKKESKKKKREIKYSHI